MTDFAALIRRLSDAEIDFILIGGVAATVHGSARLTRDVDVVYRRHPENIRKICGLPLVLDSPTMTAGLNFALTTDDGDLDLLGEMTGGGTYEQLLPHSVDVEVFGRTCHCLGLDQLIAAKRAAGRPRDIEAIAELEIIRDRTKSKSG